MYKLILVTLEGSATDRAIIEHVKPLAQLMHSRVALLHVADGWAARMFGPDAVSPEVRGRPGLFGEGAIRVSVRWRLAATAELAFGEPGCRDRQMDRKARAAISWR